MASLNVVGELSDINEQQLNYIKSVIQQLGYTDSKVTIEPLGIAGDNYIANVKRITVEDDKKGTLKIVAKIAPAHELMRKMTNTEYLFRNEHIMYTKVLPKYTELEIAADVPVKDRLRYATCYGSSNDIPNEVILLEDLKESNFVMVDRTKPISVDCVKSVLRNFASLHSLSYAFKHKEPELFAEYKNSFFDAWVMFNEQSEMQIYFKQIEDTAVTIVEGDDKKKAIEGAISRACKEVVKMTKSDKDSKHEVIQQGDAWTNNLMFNFEGETLLESVMIDYQASKPNNPVADLLYMIFNCTDYQMRKEHFHDWIDYYHNELDKSLSNYGLKANYVFPRDQLDADLKRYGRIGFGQSLLLSGVLSFKSEEASQMKKMMTEQDPASMNVEDINITKNIGAETILVLKSRMEDLVKSFQELGYI